MITGIVDRIKINGEQLLPSSESELSIPYFLQIARIIYVCFVYFAAIAQVWINLHPQHVMSLKFYSDRTRKKTLLRRLKNIGMTSGKLYRNALKQKSLLKIQPHYSQFSSESTTPSRRKTLLALEVTPPVFYAHLDIFLKNHLF